MLSRGVSHQLGEKADVIFLYFAWEAEVGGFQLSFLLILSQVSCHLKYKEKYYVNNKQRKKVADCNSVREIMT